jgi:hypothetical protein
MEKHSRDLAHLIAFIDYTKKNGYVMPKTANNRRNIVNKIFSTVQDVDTTDVTTLDLDTLFDRFKILTASKIAATALPGYKSHFTSAIRDFATYLADPAAYKPGPRGKRKPLSHKARAATLGKHPSTIAQPIDNARSTSSEIPDDQAHLRARQTKFSPSLHIDIQIHISPQASESQIDKVFESMAKHFKTLSDINIAT